MIAQRAAMALQATTTPRQPSSDLHDPAPPPPSHYAAVDHSAITIATTTTTTTLDHRHDQTRTKRPSPSPQFACLYTRHKTQKHKTWCDGRLVVVDNGGGSSGRLYVADPMLGGGDPVIDTCPLDGPDVQDLRSGQRTDLETEKFLITIEGPWPTTNTTTSSCSSLTTNNNNNSNNWIKTTCTATSKGMAKLLQTKFREPKRSGPPLPPPNAAVTAAADSRSAFLAKRQRPLQPGELQNRYYGNSNQPPAPPLAQQQQTTRTAANISTRHNGHPHYGRHGNSLGGAVGYIGTPSLYQPPSHPTRPSRHIPPLTTTTTTTTTRPSDFVSNQSLSASSFYEDDETEPINDKSRRPLATSRICPIAGPVPAAAAIYGHSSRPRDSSSTTTTHAATRYLPDHAPLPMAHPYGGEYQDSSWNGHRSTTRADDRYNDNNTNTNSTSNNDLSQLKQHSPSLNEPTNPVATDKLPPQPYISQVDMSWFGPLAGASQVGMTQPSPPPPTTTTTKILPSMTAGTHSNNGIAAQQQPPALPLIVRPTGTIRQSHRLHRSDNAFAASTDFRPSQYYEEEEEEDDDDDIGVAVSGVPLAFVVPTNHPTTTRDKLSRMALLDIFSDQPEPSTVATLDDEFVLPEPSSSDEE